MVIGDTGKSERYHMLYIVVCCINLLPKSDSSSLAEFHSWFMFVTRIDVNFLHRSLTAIPPMKHSIGKIVPI